MRYSGSIVHAWGHEKYVQNSVNKTLRGEITLEN